MSPREEVEPITFSPIYSEPVQDTLMVRAFSPWHDVAIDKVELTIWLLSALVQGRVKRTDNRDDIQTGWIENAKDVSPGKLTFYSATSSSTVRSEIIANCPFPSGFYRVGFFLVTPKLRGAMELDTVGSTVLFHF